MFFFKNDFFKWTHILMFKGDSMYSILPIDATSFFSTSLKGIIRKECQSFTNHGHAKTPPTVFNPLSLWLTLPRDIGVSHTQWPSSVTRAILACLWFAQGLHSREITEACSFHLCYYQLEPAGSITSRQAYGAGMPAILIICRW